MKNISITSRTGDVPPGYTTNARLFSLSRRPDSDSNVVFTGVTLLKCYQNHFYVNPVTFDNVNYIMSAVSNRGCKNKQALAVCKEKGLSRFENR